MATEIVLDAALAQRVDPSGMLDRINELPDQVAAAWQQTRTFQPPIERSGFDAIVITGMGGSAIGGDLVRAWLAEDADLPIIVSRDYDLPAFVGSRTLVIASSYSGNTEETLSSVEQALARGCPIVAITTGGTLARIVGAAPGIVSAIELFAYPQNQQPRAALGFSFGLLLGICERLGVARVSTADIDNAVVEMQSVRSEYALEIPEDANLAKALARALHDHIPTIYGAGVFAEVAKRWKGQMNENSKSWAGFDLLPELNHNAVVGYDEPRDLSARVHVVLLESDHDHPRNRLRLRVTAELLDQREIPYTVIPPRGAGRLAQLLSALYVGDFVSYYLALLYGQDPTPVSNIDFLKGRLAQS